jgi:glycosyltransferase involved in cell wall biosynthesis
VITLDRPNMIEVTEGAAYLVPDGKAETLTGALRAVLHDPARSADLRRRGLERTRELTWAAMAQRSMDVLWSVATSS